MRYRRLIVEGATYFFTVVTEGRRPLFQNPNAVDMLEAAISKVRTRHPFEIEVHVVLPDHLHTMWTLPRKDSRYSMRLGLIKEAFTRSYLSRYSAPAATASRLAKREQSIWQRRFWEHLIHDDRDFSAHLDYIHLNPVHHGLVRSPQDWPHSTYSTWLNRGVYQPGWGTDTEPDFPAWAKKYE